jgi:hypothetical protein
MRNGSDRLAHRLLDRGFLSWKTAMAKRKKKPSKGSSTYSFPYRDSTDPNSCDIGTTRTTTEALAEALRRIEAGELPLVEDFGQLVDVPASATAKDLNHLRGEFYRISKTEPPLTCLAPTVPPCPHPPIASHSIQRAGPISLLSDETGHVLVLNTTFKLGSMKADMVRVGINDATTFPGLCPQHDSAIFRPIDVAPLLDPSDEQMFLLSYRSVLRELYTARWSFNQLIQSVGLAFEKGAAGQLLAFALAHFVRSSWATARLAKLAAYYGRALQDQVFLVRHLIGKNIWCLPFAVSAYFEPVFNHDGSRMPAAVGSDIGPFMTLNVVPQPEGSIVVLSCAPEHRDLLDGFLAPFRAAKDELAFIEIVWEVALRYCENIIVAPMYWNVVPDEIKSNIISFYNATGHLWVPSPKGGISLFDFWKTLGRQPFPEPMR